MVAALKAIYSYSPRDAVIGSCATWSGLKVKASGGSLTSESSWLCPFTSLSQLLADCFPYSPNKLVSLPPERVHLK